VGEITHIPQESDSTSVLTGKSIREIEAPIENLDTTDVIVIVRIKIWLTTLGCLLSETSVYTLYTFRTPPRCLTMFPELFVYYYYSKKRELNRKLIYECRFQKRKIICPLFVVVLLLFTTSRIE